ncbi:hypothetical protein J2X36_005469 [Methylobacterium sp. BE186]|nr:hypothetical protein [Methylobacterium sp. BE186]
MCPASDAAVHVPRARMVEIGRDTAFEPDSHAYGNLRDTKSAAYSILPNG